uniref:Chromo domain-containing protein n=1 Tax=Glossina austeni TaxID=7395 RepID=A0A1A9VCE6_GLOAU
MDSEGEDVVEYIVERVEDKRIRNGIIEYFLKYEGYPRRHNTWEPLENLNCPNLIAAFEESLKNKKEGKKRHSCVPNNEAKIKEETVDDERNKAKVGFDRGLEPLQILDVTDSSGELMFLMKWSGTDEPELVPAKQANIICPQIVIKFYEQCITWSTSDEGVLGKESVPK